MVSDITLSEGKEIGVEEYFSDLPDSIIELIEADHNKKRRTCSLGFTIPK